MRVPEYGWVVQLLRPKPAPIPWGGAIRMGVGVVTPVAVGMASGQLGLGLIVSMGALAASLSDQGGGYASRARRMSTVAVAGALGFALGGLIFGDGLLTVAVLLLAALVGGLLSVLSNIASVATLQFLVYLIVASNVSFVSGEWWLPPLFYLLGAAWALFLSLLGGIGRTTFPERSSVAAVLDAIAALMESSGKTQSGPVRQNLTVAMNTAYDTVISARAVAGGRDRRVRRLAALLNAASPVATTTITLVRERTVIPAEFAASLSAAAEHVQHATVPNTREKRRFEDAPATAAIRSLAGSAAALASLERQIGAIYAILAGTAPGENVQQARPRLRERVIVLRDAITGGATTWLPILRLVLCLGVAEAAALLLPLQHSYWVALTVAVTLKPDFGSVFARAVQRGLGTIVGVLLGTLVLAFVPTGVPILVVMAVFAILLPISIRRNYGMFATFLTPLVVLQLDLVHSGDPQIVLARAGDTAIGCAIVLLVGYLPWPGSWRSRTVIGERIATALDGVTDYLRVAFEPVDAAHRATPAAGAGAVAVRSSARRQAYRRLSDARTALQQALAEPPPISTNASAWWPAVVALERLADAITTAVTRLALGGPAPSPAGVGSLIAAMDELSAELHEGRSSTEPAVPDDPQLAGIGVELQAAWSVLAEPDPRLHVD